MALYPIETDKIDYATRPTTPSPILSLGHFGQSLPINLEVMDAFSIHTKDMDPSIAPRRVLYDETKDLYIYADFRKEVIRLYFIWGATHQYEMLGSCLYTFDECPVQGQGEEFVDICLHPSGADSIVLSLMTINSQLRTAFVVRFAVEMSVFETLDKNAEDRIYHIDAKNFQSILNLLPQGAIDTFALPSVLTDLGWEPQTQQIIPHLHDTMCIGDIDPKYCGLTCTETGKYVALIQSRVIVHLSPFISCPIDVQYVISMDEYGMQYTWRLIGPLCESISFDETTEGQPYLQNPTVIDGDYLICNEVRHSRYLQVATSYPPGSNSGDLKYITGTVSWPGGWVAGLYLPSRRVAGTGDRGYASAWETPTEFEPARKDIIWRLTKISELPHKTPQEFIDELWQPVNLPHYPIDVDFPTALNVFGNFASTWLEGHLIRFNVNYLVFFEQPPEEGGLPQASIYISGLIPQHTLTQEYTIKNVSRSCHAKYIQHIVSNLPDDVTVEVDDLPDSLAPQESATFSVTATYDPEEDTPPNVRIEAVLSLSYYLVTNANVTPIVP